MLLSMLMVFWFFVFGILSNEDISVLQCDKYSENIKCRFSSKVPYRYVANYDDSEIKFAGCEAKKFWFIGRHGTRNPSKKFIKDYDQLEIIANSVINSCARGCEFTSEHINKLNHYKERLANVEHILTEEGERELIALGERYQARFPGLIPEKYDNKTFKFQFTATQRAEESAKHFVLGLFGKEGSTSVYYPSPKKKDPILRFYKACDRWQKEVKENPESKEEERKFENIDLVKDMLKNVSNRLGLNVTFENVRMIYQTCAFETAWSDGDVSPWCNLLVAEEFKIFEFWFDIHYYWIDGYGFPLTYEQACNGLLDMFNFMDTEDEVKMSAYFTHSGTLLKLISLLGLARDNQPMRHDLYPFNDRLWRTSLIDPFASNLAFISFNCSLSGMSLLTMHQERIVNLPGCPENIPCPLSTMKDEYPDRQNECEFERMCRVLHKH